MSGGVDSAVAAALMREMGYEGLGVTMKLRGDTAGGSCGTAEDAADAAAICEKLQFPHTILDCSADFGREVVDRFVEAYEQGRTPNPCIDCNRYMKFGRLHRVAAEMDCDKVVTGHYARIVFENGRWLLKKGADPRKDQSYVLYFLSQEQLSRTLLPLGEFSGKDAVRQIAEEKGFVNAHKPDSQDICFVPDGDYAAFIRAYTGKEYPAGDFVDPDGKVLGQHKGLIHYTIGQRRGLGLALLQPGYVTEKRIAENQVVVSPREGLLCDCFRAKDPNWIAFDTPPAAFTCLARTRYQGPEYPCTVTIDRDGGLLVCFDAPQKRPAAGQSVVFYEGDTVLGGATII
ncbi:MAG: tRNA 2-thiouridine(34) synthase MnmA [Clostridia bacterium]|nr:tRNA 2-thiouridine(34) synthase MnmA [Clostridia bacterium]